jgi:hypothetical protein
MINEERPARSGIVLSLGSQAAEDGVLQLGEIRRRKLRAGASAAVAVGS